MAPCARPRHCGPAIAHAPGAKPLKGVRERRELVPGRSPGNGSIVSSRSVCETGPAHALALDSVAFSVGRSRSPGAGGSNRVAMEDVLVEYGGDTFGRAIMDPGHDSAPTKPYPRSGGAQERERGYSRDLRFASRNTVSFGYTAATGKVWAGHSIGGVGADDGCTWEFA